MHLRLQLCILVLACVALFVIAKPITQVDDITDVHIVFSCHLDVGYTNMVYIVLNTYFNEYFPSAIQTANALRQRGGEERLIFTTHPWLLSLYFDCENAVIPGPIQCPSASAKQDLFEAIQRGDIVYQAYPFNAQNELLEPSMFKFGLTVAQKLDTLFGKTEKTITMSQRDVPGISRSIIPILNAEGIKALSVGVNGGSAPPDVPKAFIWSDEQSNNSIIAMWHPGGYGGIGINDCVIVPGFSHALAFAWRGDNAGPPSVDEVLGNFAQVKKEFPNAKVYASTFDNFVKALEPNKHLLPVVTKEVGDTWIIFQAADPLKQTYFREIQRARVECIAQKKCNPEDIDFFRADRLLLKVSEHTGSADDVRYLKDYSNWSNVQFEKVRNESNYKFMLGSFLEQRQYISNAISLYPDFFAAEIKERIAALTPASPSTTGYTSVKDFSTIFSFGGTEVGFSPAGGISHLVHTSTKKSWASLENSIGYYRYITMSADDFTTWLKAYSYCSDIYAAGCDWVLKAHGKYNVSEAHPEHLDLFPRVVALYYKNDTSSKAQFLVQTMFSEPEARLSYGAASHQWSHFTIDSTPEGTINVNITFQWFDKTATRLPESHWFGFNPVVSEPSLWKMDKIGELVSPLDVVVNGSHNLHGINPLSGIYYNDGKSKIVLRSLDIPMVSPGVPNALPAPFVTPDLTKGFSYLLFANIWGTNWPEWYPFVPEDINSLFRFEVQLE